MTTYGYVRCSTVEQTDGTTLEDQERRIRGCAAMRGDEPAEIVCDAGVSGTIALFDRPGGGKLRGLLKSGDILIASKLDRIFRDACDALVTAEDFKKLGVGLILIDMGIEPITATGVPRIMFGFMALMAEFERNRTLERTAEGRKGKKSRGGHIGGYAPYGFKKEGAGREAILTVDSKERDMLLMARGCRDEGMSLRQISSVLCANGHFNRAGQPFDARQVQRILGR